MLLEIQEEKNIDNTESFNWEEFESGIEPGINMKKDDLRKMYEENFTDLNEHEIITGKVVAITDKEVIVDINFKSEGVISLNEFRYNPSLKIGDLVEIIVSQREDKNGQLILSHKKARTLNAWTSVNKAHDNNEIVNGFIKARTKGGMIVDVFGIEAFLPGSQIDVKPIRDYEQYVGKTMEFKVVKINPEFKNVVVSHKALIEADIEVQKKEIVSQLQKGQVLEGEVKNITSYGVFVDLGGVDGLIHITDLSWSRINHPSEILSDGQKINVVILDFDEQKSRIQLGIKQLEPHPWESLDENIKVGDKVKGKVVVLADYGAFVEVAPGVEGLIHVSEMSWSTHLRSAQDFVKVGDEIESIILTLDRSERKMSLGMKQLTPDPWADIANKYPVGSKHKGKVRNFTNFGIFLELEEGVDGLIYISDLSWTKKIKHPSEFCSVDDIMEVIVLDLDIDSRRLSLGHKQLTESPWAKFESKYNKGSIHKVTISEVFDKGIKLKLEDEELEGFISSRNLVRYDGVKYNNGNQIEVKVLDFNKDSNKIIFTTNITKEEVTINSNNKNSDKNSKDNSINATTLGDLDELAALKKRMDSQNMK